MKHPYRPWETPLKEMAKPNPFVNPYEKAIKDIMKKFGCDRKTAIDFLRERD